MERAPSSPVDASLRGRHSAPLRTRVLRGCTFALALLALLAASPAFAEPPAREHALPADPTLTRLIAESLAARPEIAQASALVRVAQERAVQADSLPDPMLEVGIQNDGFTSIEIGHMESSYVSLMASQTFPWPGKRDLRREVAQLGTAQSKQAVTRARLSTEAEVRRAYLALLFVRERLTLQDRLDTLWQASLGVALARYRSGDGTQSDVLRAQLEIRRAMLRRVALRADERARTQALNRLRGHPLEEAIPTSTAVRDLPPIASPESHFSAERALALSPEIAAAKAALSQTGKSVALAEKGYYPDLTVGAGLMIRGLMPPMWLVTVGGPLPVFAGDKQDRAVAQAQAQKSATESEVSALEQLVRLRSAERRGAFDALRQTIDLYEQGLLVQSEATTESTLSQYQAGKVTFASVLEANAGFIADEEGHLAALVEAQRLAIAEAELSLSPSGGPAGAASSGSMPGAGATSMDAPSAAGAAAPAAQDPAAAAMSGM
jgi:cobalt-zinc-cadmium efflux system outer membrane protein